jgi:phage shock protein C
MERKLFRSRKNRMFLGVCGGFGECYRMDPVIVRVISVLITVASGFGPGVIAYFILALIIPLEGSKAGTTHETFKENLADLENSSKHIGDQFKSSLNEKHSEPAESLSPAPGFSFPPPNRSNRSIYIFAVAMVTIGVFFIIVNSFGWLWRYIWPLTLIIAGVIIIALVFTRKKQI